jgi:DNA-binding NtrC family response regulator
MCSSNVWNNFNKAKVVMTGLRNRILCIDDSQDSCDLVDFIFSEAGYKIQLANSLHEALELIQTNQYDLCLLDISLPDGSGLDLISKLRSLDPLLQIIVCSGDVRPQTYQEVSQAGAVAFVSKPIDFDLLLATVANCLNAD